MIMRKVKNENVFTFPSLIAGNPSSLFFLIAETINSLNKIIDRDQKGIKLKRHNQIRGIKVNILSERGSIIAPNLLLIFSFLARYPSK